MTFSNQLFKKLNQNPNKVWILADDMSITHRQILDDIELLKEKLRIASFSDLKRRIIGIAMKTSYDFIIADLTCIKEQAVTLPIPLEFEDGQIKSLLMNVEIVLVRNDADANRLQSILPEKPILNVVNGKLLNGDKQRIDGLNVSENIIKIIHTSGTTSDPKGVLIKDESLRALTESLLSVFPKQELTYLSLIPLSLLVEQIFAIYCTLLTGGKLILLPESMNEFGKHGNTSDTFLDLIQKHKPNFIYLAPRLLNDLNQLPCLDGFSKDAYYVTEGAKVNYDVINSLDQKGIKIYEGYGLSETTSVVSINGIADRKIGTAGKILPHLEYKICEGELLLKGTTLCAGYFTKDESSCHIDDDGYLHTGDLVEVDKDRYLTIKGRKKNLLILSNARNISPEWVESKLKKFSEVEDCIILGEGRDSLTAIILANKKSKTVSNIASIIKETNFEIPSFAQIQNFITISDADDFKRKYFTITGRPRRSCIHKDYINEL